jgi:hypothetical protein
MAADTPTGGPTEKEIVDTWIEERFTSLGFTALQATLLRIAGADWHLAEKYLDQGCSHEHAVTILT